MNKQVRIFSFFAALVAGMCSALAATPVNPRATERGVDATRATVGALTRNAARTTRTRTVVRPRTGTSLSRAGATRTLVPVVRNTDKSRAATVSRSAIAGGKTNVRASGGTNVSGGGIARSAKARATAVFNDISKIGSGYAECRESYATCMDQMCANANDTYRRCFCSNRFMTIRDTESKLDQAMLMLQQFQDNNLNAVDKTAAEVNAMYSATVGEEAIKSDTSASAELLNNIGILLNGGSLDSGSSNNSDSLGILDWNFSIDDSDIWGNAEDSIFDSNATDLSTLQGVALFNAAQNQCVRLSQNRCDNDAVFTMARSSYNILITQDCNAYEKTLNKKRETLAQAVRTAEKYLREARLEEYRTHNSADVNECLAKVRTTMLSETACGAGYKRCLDPTGAYIEASTGEPIYSPRLFQLENTMKLDGVSFDVLSQNPTYSTFLDKYKKSVARDLDTCRDIANDVWTEFKRMAIIEIAQAQNAKLEEVRESCVDTIADCYDTQTNALVNMAGDASMTAGALGQFTARKQCREKVIACATLFVPSGSEGNKSCQFNDRGRLTGGDGEAESCGLRALLDYVNAVDSINIADKCGKALNSYLTDMCTPDDKYYKYPYKCRLVKYDTIEKQIDEFVKKNCKSSEDTLDDNRLTNTIYMAKDDLKSAMRDILKEECQDVNGMWYDTKLSEGEPDPSAAFYTKVFGRSRNDDYDTWGICYESSDYVKCIGYNTDDRIVATWNRTTEQCTFKDAWYQEQCELIGGYYENAMCYMLNEATE